jgi:hypothetical protein
VPAKRDILTGESLKSLKDSYRSFPVPNPSEDVVDGVLTRWDVRDVA